VGVPLHDSLFHASVLMSIFFLIYWIQKSLAVIGWMVFSAWALWLLDQRTHIGINYCKSYHLA
jgi:hypothetical protein